MPNPKLRPLNFEPVIHQNQPMWLVTDPLRLAGQQILLPSVFGPLLALCDGSHSLSDIHTEFCQQVGESVPLELIEGVLAQLDQLYFLDNGRAQEAVVTHLAQYRAMPHRPPALAGLSYPANARALSRLLQGYGDGDALHGWQPWRGRGIISPHIDYHRGGPVYAQVWRRAATAVQEADLVLILGTDHNGGAASITLTRQPYATPYGVLPTDLPLIAQLAEAIGPESAFASELHHRHEHSVELSAVWLHHICQQTGTLPPPMIPILCGSFHHFVANGVHPAEDERLTAVVQTLQQATQGRRVLVVASVDLAHVGPAFGDRFQMDQERRAALRQSDQALLQAILQGDSADFYQQIAAVEDRNRICGFSAIYLLLRTLQGGTGQQVAYAHCPADQEDNSLVSICGLLLD